MDLRVTPWGCAILLALIALATLLGTSQAGLSDGAQQTGKGSQPNLAALIIDDLGDMRQSGVRAINLPANVTIAVLPHTPFSDELAELAHARGREVMLHMPMEPTNRIYPGPGALYLDMHEHEVRRAMRAALADVPHVRGVNNHMGSLITRHPGHMEWVMEELRKAGNLYFIDSRTSARTVAQKLAAEQGLKNASRSVFLDPSRDNEIIERQIKRFIAAAHQQDGVIAIAHPYPQTLDLLEEYLPKFDELGIKLVPPSVLVDESSAESCTIPTADTVDMPAPGAVEEM